MLQTQVSNALSSLIEKGRFLLSQADGQAHLKVLMSILSQHIYFIFYHWQDRA